MLRMFCAILLVCLFQLPGFAGVSHPIQDRYRRSYENKALFLKIPIFSERQFVHITGRNVRPEPGTGAPRFKVGDQLRVLGLDFGGDEIKFRLGAISGPMVAEVVFKFDTGLTESFPNSDVFDRALQATFTEGFKYSDLDEAKRSYVEDQFDNAVSEQAAKTKKIDSPVAGKADVLIAPDLEAANMLAKQLQYLAGADAAGIVLGAKVPIVLTSRADTVRTRLASAAVMARVAQVRRDSAIPAAR